MAEHLIKEFNRVIDQVNEIFINFTKSNKDINDKLDFIFAYVERQNGKKSVIPLIEQMAEKITCIHKESHGLVNRTIELQDQLALPITNMSGQLEMICQNLGAIYSTILLMIPVQDGGVPLTTVTAERVKDLQEWANEVLAPKPDPIAEFEADYFEAAIINGHGVTPVQREIPIPATEPPLDQLKKRISPATHSANGVRRKTNEADLREIRKRLLAGQTPDFIRDDMGMAPSTFSRAFRKAKMSGTQGWWEEWQRRYPTIRRKYR